MPSRVRNWLPGDVAEFLQTASKKLPGDEAWKRNVLRDMQTILVRMGGADIVWGPYYLTYREDTSNKFHYFVVFGYQDTTGQMMYVGSNAFGPIGKKAKVFEIIRTPSKNQAIDATSNKMSEKRAKGYEEER
jgi:predicted DNA-binding WGR domain protein